jgi:hypothetical protein
MNVHFGEASDTEQKYSHLDYFLMMYPPVQITAILQLTNIELRLHQKKELSRRGELIRFFGTMILATRFQFNGRHDLRSTTSRTQYIPAPRFGEKTGFCAIALLICGDTCAGVSNQRRSQKVCLGRWMLVDDHVKMFNNHRQRMSL